VLVRLDQANAKIAVAQAEADLAAARRRFGQAVATNGALSAQIDTSSAGSRPGAGATCAAAEAEFDKAQDRSWSAARHVVASGADVGRRSDPGALGPLPPPARRSRRPAVGISEVSSARRVAPGPVRGQRRPGARL
jgi:membrane fusion protein (multidrug efflux system)